MKLLCSYSALLILTLLAPAGRAQSPPLAGFVFVNAIGISDKADIAANGRKLTLKGLEAGGATSGLGLPAGAYQIQVTAANCEPVSASLQIAVGVTPILIAYLEKVPQPGSNVLKNYLRVVQIPAQPQTQGTTITVISVEPNKPVSVKVGTQTQTLEFRKPVRLEGKDVKAIGGPEDVQEVSAEDKGSYLCVLFRKADGKVGVILVPEQIYQW